MNASENLAPPLFPWRNETVNLYDKSADVFMETKLILALLAVLAFLLLKAAIVPGGWSLPKGASGGVDDDFLDDLRKSTDKFYEDKRWQEFVNGD